MENLEKVYVVEFMHYSNAMKDYVSNNADTEKDVKYLNVGREPFLVKESDLEKYRGYGGGFRSITFVGNIEK